MEKEPLIINGYEGDKEFSISEINYITFWNGFIDLILNKILGTVIILSTVGLAIHLLEKGFHESFFGAMVMICFLPLGMVMALLDCLVLTTYVEEKVEEIREEKIRRGRKRE